jgi:hypothetical protein
MGSRPNNWVDGFRSSLFAGFHPVLRTAPLGVGSWALGVDERE